MQETESSYFYRSGLNGRYAIMTTERSFCKNGDKINLYINFWLATNFIF